jgi:hypothetical protein
MGTRQLRQLPIFIGSIHFLKICLFSFPKLPRIHTFHPVEETGEGGDFGEISPSCPRYKMAFRWLYRPYETQEPKFDNGNSFKR